MLRPFTLLDITEWYAATSGGIRTYLQQKSAYVLRHPELRHVVVVPGADDVVTEAGNVRHYELRGPRIPRQQQYRLLYTPRSLRRIVLAERPDVIEIGSQLLTPWLARVAGRGAGIPAVAFHHTNVERLLVGSGTGEPWRAPLRPLVRAYLRRTDALVDARIAASDTLDRDLQGAGIRNVTRIPLGVDLQTFHPQRSAAAACVRATIDVPEGTPLVIYAGRLAREKDLPVLLDAWTDVEASTDAWLVIAGDGPLAGLVRERASARRIRVLPFQSDRQAVAELLAAAAVTVAPGCVETFGLAPLESLACGTPIVGADRGAVAELISRSGAGAMFRSGDASSLAAAIRALLAADRAALAVRARRHAEREHGWDAVFDRLFDFYRGLVRR